VTCLQDPLLRTNPLRLLQRFVLKTPYWGLILSGSCRDLSSKPYWGLILSFPNKFCSQATIKIPTQSIPKKNQLKKHGIDYYSVLIFYIREIATAHALYSAVPDIGSYSFNVKTLVGVSLQWKLMNTSPGTTCSVIFALTLSSPRRDRT
jgi:hypothetical protein